MKGKSESLRRAQTLALVWTVGLVLGILVWTLRKVGIIEARGFSIEKFKSQEGKGVVLFHNHPSWMEPVIIPALFFPRFLLDPYKVPLSVPDKHNYYDKWWWRPLKVVCIPMPRGNRQGEGRALLQMLEELRKGRTIAIALEGGRTWKGDRFKRLSPDGETVVLTKAELAGPDGKIDLSNPVIRCFREGTKHLVSAAVFVPVWVDVREWKIRIVVGDRFTFGGSLPQKGATGYLEKLLLESAEE